MPSPIMAAEIATLQKLLDRMEKERDGLQKRLKEVSQERDELFQLCDILRDEMVAVADDYDYPIRREEAAAPVAREEIVEEHAPESSHEEVSSDQIDSEHATEKGRRQLKRMEREVEKYRYVHDLIIVCFTDM